MSHAEEYQHISESYPSHNFYDIFRLLKANPKVFSFIKFKGFECSANAGTAHETGSALNSSKRTSKTSICEVLVKESDLKDINLYDSKSNKSVYKSVNGGVDLDNLVKITEELNKNFMSVKESLMQNGNKLAVLNDLFNNVIVRQTEIINLVCNNLYGFVSDSIPLSYNGNYSGKFILMFLEK
jgi:hypothetical protein